MLVVTGINGGYATNLCLVMANARNDIIVQSIPMENDHFGLQFIHSVLGTKVMSDYKITNSNQIIQISETFSGFGYGLPNDTPTITGEKLQQLTGDTWQLTMHRPIDNLVVIPIKSQHTSLILNGHSFALHELPTHHLRIEVQPCQP